MAGTSWQALLQGVQQSGCGSYYSAPDPFTPKREFKKPKAGYIQPTGAAPPIARAAKAQEKSAQEMMMDRAKARMQQWEKAQAAKKAALEAKNNPPPPPQKRKRDSESEERERGEKKRPAKGGVVRLKTGTKWDGEGCLRPGEEGTVVRDLWAEKGQPGYIVRTFRGTSEYDEEQLELVARSEKKAQKKAKKKAAKAAVEAAKMHDDGAAEA